MTRVLVTGAGGFLGSHLVEELVKDPTLQVVCVDSFRHNGEVDRLNLVLTDHTRPRVRLLNHDLNVPFTSRHVRQLDSVYAIFDAASQSSVDVSIAQPREVILNNVNATLSTLELARELGCQLYLHVSTDEVYGAVHEMCSAAEHQPSSPYAASKAAQEDICRAYRVTYGLPVKIVTSANLFGERQSSLAFIPKIVKAALDRSTVSVHTYDGQPGRRDYNYVRDVSRYLTAKMREVAADRWPERVGLGGRYTCDNESLVEGVERALRMPIRRRRIEGIQARPGYDGFYPDVSADLLDGFGDWLPAATVADDEFFSRLKDTVNWFVANHDWLD